MDARLVTTTPEKTRADAMVIPLLEGPRTVPREVSALDRTLGGALTDALRQPTAGRFMQTTLVHGGRRGGPNWIVLIGLGHARELDAVRLRNALQQAGRVLRRQGSRKVAVVVTKDMARTGQVAEVARAVTEAIALSNFDIGMLKSTSNGERTLLEGVSIVGLDGKGAGAAEAIRDGIMLAEATNRARQWVNLPANAFTPTIFVEKARAAARGSGVEVRVLELADMRRLKMGALIAVAKGSDEPPKLIVMRYRGGGRKGAPVLGLVGKGITFDSGGISIKPAAGMEGMKGDMGGGAAVVNAILAIAALKPKLEVIGVIPTTENMPSGKASKPGDVVTASNGKTIEIINTDAEGRLILADGIVYAISQGATHIIDVATLTGSIMRTLGPVATGAFSNNPALMALVRQAADLAGERVWELPTWADYDGLIVSEVADIKNSTVPWAGATTAALFLREFVDGRPWVHLDIAGSAWQDEGALKTIPKGPTGAGVRLLAHLATLIAER